MGTRSPGRNKEAPAEVHNRGNEPPRRNDRSRSILDLELYEGRELYQDAVWIDRREDPIPEIVELHKLRIQLVSSWTGRRVEKFTAPSDSPNPKKYAQDGWSEFTRHVLNRKILNIQRLGKNLWIQLPDQAAWHIHLSSTGWLLPGNEQARNVVETNPIWQNFIHRINERNVRVRIYLDDGQIWNYHDPRTWGKWWLRKGNQPREDPYFQRHGPDWILEARRAIRRLRNHYDHRTIKNVLTDQTITAGLGNYLSCEIAHHAKIHPLLPWTVLSQVHKKKLTISIIRVIRTCLNRDDHSHWKVFKRRGMRCECGDLIAYMKDSDHGSRGSYFCPTCQPI